MSTYIHKMVGSDEKLIGVARLHWIYLVKGMVGFALCMLLAYAVNTAIEMLLALLYRHATPADGSYPFMAVNHYFSQFMFLCGVYIFGIYLVKVLGTEVGLTTRRMIFKTGLVFVSTHEVDIEEIRGERMDLGWFGRFLDYAYIKLDCRFVEDLSTPAIEKPERFIRALHKLRSDASDSVVTIATHPDESGVARAHISRKGAVPMPEHGTVEAMDESGIPEHVKGVVAHAEVAPQQQRPAAAANPAPGTWEMPPMTAPDIPESQHASPVQAQPPMQPDLPPLPPEVPSVPQPAHPPATPPAPPAPPEIPTQPVPVSTPPTAQQPQTQAAAPLDPQMVADIVKQTVDEMTAQGMVMGEQPVAPEDALLSDFDHASGEQKPRAIH